MISKRGWTLLLASALVFQLAACDSQITRAEPPLRSVKLVTVGASDASAPDYVAVVRHAQHADLAFESEGRLTGMQVDVGDRVRRGQVLATLDDEAAQLHVRQGEAKVKAAQAQFDVRRDQLRQQQAMFEDGAIAAATRDASSAALTVAQAELQDAQLELSLARRALRNTVLSAPFDGTVTGRLVQNGSTVGTGQTVLQVEGSGRLQAVAALPPDALAATLKPGETVAGRVDDAAGTNVGLKLRGVAERIDAGGTVQTRFDIEGNPGLRSGQVLHITMPVPRTGPVTVPVTAVVPGTTAGTGYAFVFHTEGSVVERRAISLGGYQGTGVEVTRGLSDGDRIVSTGAAFLSNAQKVLPYIPATTLTREEP